MSKERARRREAREREAAAEAAELAAAKRKQERRQALVAPVLGPARRLKVALTTGKQTGSLAQRRRTRVRLLFVAFVLLQVLVWMVRPDWGARVGALIIGLIALPVVAVFAL